MLLKSADDKTKRLRLLEDLQKANTLNARQKTWLREELMRLRKGIQGEKESAYYIDSHFKDGENHVILHDLRFVVDGDVAQIDHLIFNRVAGIYLVETKNYAGNLVINEHGEFTVEYDDDRFGIPSPIEQSKRHERVLAKLLERLDITGRTQKAIEMHHVVMLHPKAIIQRPPLKAFDSSMVIKADQFPEWHRKFVDSIGLGTILKVSLNMRSLDTLKEWGEKLMRQHRPADLLALPEFMQPQPAKPQTPPAAPPPSAKTVAPRAVQPATIENAKPAAAAETPEPAKRLICTHCGAKISYPEGKFCWNQPVRFGGNQYCRAHQALF